MTNNQKKKLAADIVDDLMARCKGSRQQVASVSVEWHDTWNDDHKERDLGIERQILPKVTLTFHPEQ